MVNSPEKQELVFRRILIAFSIAAGVVFLIQAAVSLWVSHGITEVEAIIAAQATALATGGGLYTDLNSYPFTVSPYGPILYGLEAAVTLLGISPMLFGRAVSLTALIFIVWLTYRLIGLHTENRYAAWAGALLAASTANLVTWGSVGQSDMLGLLFSVAALERYSAYRASGGRAALFASAVLIAAAIFTKQTFLAAGATISILHFVSSPGRSLRYILGLAAAGGAIVLTLNWATAGSYWSNAVLANLNPFSFAKLGDQLEYFGFTATALCLLAACGLAARKGYTPHPFVLYLGFSAAMFLATAPKLGADLNYQIETVLALSLCSGLARDRLHFFPLLFAGDKGWVTLLQIPLLFHIVLNCVVTGKVAIQRLGSDMARQEQYTELLRHISTPGRLLSVEIDHLLQSNRPIEVEPLIYTLLVDAEMADPGPVLRDLQEGQFDNVVLYQDVTDRGRVALPAEVPNLPSEHLQVIRYRYRLVKHIPGPLLGGIYLYDPVEVGAAPAHPTRQTQANAR